MKNNSDIENLKSVFSHSSENVFFLDYDFNILWCSSQEFMPVLKNIREEGFFAGESLPLESGEYSLRYGGLIFMCRVINYSECGIYVVQSAKDDAFYSFFKCSTVQEFLINQAGAVRQAVMGITSSSSVIHKTLEDAGFYAGNRYLDITMGNCYKLLRTVMNTTELIRYTDGSVESVCIDVAETLDKFTSLCRDILDPKIKIRMKISDPKKLFIKADAERFTSCLLSMIVFVNGKDPLNNTIDINAGKIDDCVSVTIKSGRTGEETINRIYSRFNELYESENLNSDLFVISRFCREFNGTMLMAEEKDNKSCSIKLPVCKDEEERTVFDSYKKSYPSDKFSKYHIALSAITDIFYF
ncbi:MAG: hypothetical protein ACI4I9_10340 [Porcipelethomonas sp.]